MKEVIVTPFRGGIVISTIDEQGETTVVNLNKTEACRIAASILLAVFEPDMFNETEIDNAASMILGEYEPLVGSVPHTVTKEG